MSFPPNLRIAQSASLKPLGDIAEGMGIGPHLMEPYGEHVAKIKLSAIDELADRPAGQVRRRLRGHPHAAGRGQDHHHGRARPGVLAHREAGHGGDPAALHGPDVRDQGRRGGWRLQPGRTDGDPQPAPHRRLPRGHGGAQPAVRGARQPPPPGQRGRHRPARHHVAARARRQRPRAAQHRRGPRRQAGRCPPADRLRHHRRQRGDGDLRARHVAAGDAGAARPHRRRLHVARAHR